MLSGTATNSLPSVSVVLGSFNGERYIAQQIDSIINQSYPPKEVVVADDCSTDRTLDIVRSFINRSKIPIRIVERGNNIGFGRNFLSGSKLASADIIAFSDQDDIWHPDKLAVCVERFSDPLIVLVAHSAQLIDQGGASIGRFTQYIKKDCLIGPLSGDPWGGHFGFSMVFRKSLLDLVPADKFDINLNGKANKAHDTWVSILARSAGKIACISRDLVNYRQHGDNVYGVPSKHKISKCRTEIAETAQHRSRSAAEIRDLLSEVGFERTDKLPGFDRSRAVQWWNQVHDLQQARGSMFSCTNRMMACSVWARTLVCGSYFAPKGMLFNIKTAVKDIAAISTIKWP
ncbi:glycosyltransferase family 2 protein [Methylobacterium sp. P31]